MSQNMLPIDLGKLTDVGKTRTHNEDAIQTWHSAWDDKNGGRLFIVADGVGGESHGDIASQLTIQYTGYLYYDTMRKNPDLPARGTLVEVLNQVNQYVYQQAEQRNAAGHMASTVVAAVLRGKRLTVAWIGDSRAYLLRQNQRGIQQITQDHSQVEEQFRAGLLTAEQAANHPAKNILSRSVGGRPSVVVDSVEYEIEEGDTLLMCSDGLTRHVNDQELEKIIRGSPDSQTAAKSLVQLANRRGGRDNISVIVVYFGQRGSSTAIYGTFIPFDERDTDPGVVIAQPEGFLDDEPSETATFAPAVHAPAPVQAPSPDTQSSKKSGCKLWVIMAGLILIGLMATLLVIASQNNNTPPRTPETATISSLTASQELPPSAPPAILATENHALQTIAVQTATQQAGIAQQHTATQSAQQTQAYAIQLSQTQAAEITQTAIVSATNGRQTQQAATNQASLTQTSIVPTSTPLPSPTPTIMPSPTPSSNSTLNTSNWRDGTRLRVRENTTLYASVNNPAGGKPVTANTIVTIKTHRTDGIFRYTTDSEVWWHVDVSGIGTGWLPQSVLERVNN